MISTPKPLMTAVTMSGDTSPQSCPRLILRNEQQRAYLAALWQRCDAPGGLSGGERVQRDGAPVENKASRSCPHAHKMTGAPDVGNRAQTRSATA
jgi:hypothetical protein